MSFYYYDDFNDFSDISEMVFEKLNKAKIEDYLDEDLDEYFERVEPFQVKASMFPKKEGHLEVVRFETREIEDTGHFLRMLKMLTECLDGACDDLISKECFGDDYTVNVKFSEYRYYTVKLEKNKGYSISLIVNTTSEPVDQLEVA